jgi:hypothetical protein
MGKKLITAIFLMLALMAVSPAIADQLNTSGLTDEQMAQLQLQIAQLKKQNDGVSEVKRENKWILFGKNITQALAASAKELGVPVETFIQSDIGITAKNIIVWKLIGKELVGVAFGSFLLLFGLPVWVHFFRRMCVIKSTVVEYPNNEKSKKVERHEYFRSGEVDGARIGMFFTLAGIIACSLLVIFLSL